MAGALKESAEAFQSTIFKQCSGALQSTIFEQ